MLSMLKPAAPMAWMTRASMPALCSTVNRRLNRSPAAAWVLLMTMKRVVLSPSELMSAARTLRP